MSQQMPLLLLCCCPGDGAKVPSHNVIRSFTHTHTLRGTRATVFTTPSQFSNSALPSMQRFPIIFFFIYVSGSLETQRVQRDLQQRQSTRRATSQERKKKTCANTGSRFFFSCLQKVSCRHATELLLLPLFAESQHRCVRSDLSTVNTPAPVDAPLPPSRPPRRL